MKKTIEYNISKEEMVRRINALIDGEIKLSDVNWNVFGHFYGSVSEDKFTLGSMSSFDLRIEGSFRKNDNKVDLDIDYHDIKALMYMMLNGISTFSIVLSIIGHEYLFSIAVGVIMLMGNIFLVWLMNYSANVMYEMFCKLIKP